MNPAPKPTEVSHEELVRMLQENKALILDTNNRIKRMETRANIALAFKLLWIVILLALPFILFSVVSNVFSARVDATTEQNTDYSQIMMNLGEVINLYRGQ